MMKITLKNRKFRLAACGLCLIAFGIGLVACKQEAKSQIQNPASEEECEGDILVHLGAHKLLIPRDGVRIEFKDNTDVAFLNRSHAGLGCDAQEFHDVASVSWPDFEITAIPENVDPYNTKTLFKRYQNEIDAARKNKLAVNLDNGIEKIPHKSREFFLFPLSVSNTLLKEPIIIDCSRLQDGQVLDETSTDFCSTSYYTSEKLGISYKFFRKDVEPDAFVEINNKYLERLRKYLIPENNYK